MLLCLSRYRWKRGWRQERWRREDSVNLAGDVALEAPQDLPSALALRGAPGYVFSGAFVPAHPPERQHVQRPVCVPVASAVEAVANRLARGGLKRGHAAQAGEGRLALKPFGVVSDGDQQRGCRVGAHTAQRGEGGDVLGHQPPDLLLQFGYLLGKPLVATGDGPHRQLGRGPHLVGKATRTEARRGGDQLGRGKTAQFRLEFFRRGDEQRAQLVRGLRARLYRRAPHHVQDAHHLRGPVGALGLAGGGAGLHGPRGGLGVCGVVLAEPAPVLAVRAVHLDDLYPSSAQEADQSHTEAAAALDTGSEKRSELLRPSHQRSVAGLRRGHGLVTEASTEVVEGYHDVLVGVRVYAQDDERLFQVHRFLLSLEKLALSLCTHQPADGGQYCDETWWGQAPIRSHPAPTGGATASLQTGRRIR